MLSAWLVGDVPPVTSLSSPPDKIVVCGPHDGQMQISIWGAAPIEGETLDVTLSDDRTQIVVLID